jgi:hypothetical protein
MGKQIEKKVVPPREERREQMGDSKPPKMGGVTPQTVEVPEVDDLLEKLKKIGVGPQTRKELLRVPSPGAVDFNGLRRMVDGDWDTIFTEGGHCHVNCKCPPCQSGYCSRCTVEAMRDDVDRTAVRAAVAEFRGVVLQ